MKTLLLFFIWLGLFFDSLAQSPLTLQSFGASSVGMGGIKHYVMDSWTIFNQVGALNRLDRSIISANFDQRFGIKELSTIGFSGAWKTSAGTAGVGLARIGSPLFNQQMLGLGFSNTLGIVSIGAKIDWHQTQIEGFGSGHAFLFTFGGVAELSPELFFGAQVTNVNQARFSRFSENRLPSTLQIGLAYVPYASTKIILESEKPLEGNAIIRLGLEHEIKNWLFLRAGVGSQPARLHFGLGIEKDWFGFDYALGQHTALGNTHHFSLNFLLD